MPRHPELGKRSGTTCPETVRRLQGSEEAVRPDVSHGKPVVIHPEQLPGAVTLGEILLRVRDRSSNIHTNSRSAQFVPQVLQPTRTTHSLADQQARPGLRCKALSIASLHPEIPRTAGHRPESDTRRGATRREPEPVPLWRPAPSGRLSIKTYGLLSGPILFQVNSNMESTLFLGSTGPPGSGNTVWHNHQVLAISANSNHP